MSFCCKCSVSLSLAPSLLPLSLYAARTYLVNWFCVCASVCVRVLVCVCLVAFAFKIFLSSASCAVCFDCFVLWQRPKGVGDVAEMVRCCRGTGIVAMAVAVVHASSERTQDK